jgi:hypothetical protein
MSWLPRETEFGELQLVDTFIYYDGPRLFSARSLTDQNYLAAWANEGETGDDWLYLPVSQVRLDIVRTGARTVRSAFLQPEGSVYVVTIPHDEAEPDSVARIVPSDIPETWLPGDQFRIQDSIPTAGIAETPVQIEIRARQEHRTRLRLHLVYADKHRTEAPTRQVGALLLDAQKLIDNVGWSIESEKVASRGAIPKNTRRRTSSDVVALSAASFVIELGASSFDDLLGDSLFADSAKAIISLMDPGKRAADLAPELGVLGPRATKSFRSFVEQLTKTGADFGIAAAGSAFPYQGFDLTSQRVGDLYRILSNEIVDDDIDEIRARMDLVAYDAERQTFGLRDGEDRIEGRVDERVSRVYRNPTIHQFYDVLIYATSTLDEMTNEVKVTYALMQLAPATDDAEDDVDAAD